MKLGARGGEETFVEPREMYKRCLGALKAYADNAGFTDVVIGLSGGLDSSVIAALCVDAFGASHVHGVLLPGPYSSKSSVDDALDLAQRCGIDTQTISITEPWQAFAKVMAPAFGGAFEGVASENTQARCRMIVLMALSNKYNWMLVNTGNKSEACMGYSTLYGDTAGAFAPIGGLYKTDVYAVGRVCNQVAVKAGRPEPIPENVFVKPPSAELAADQEDEKSFGMSYELLDRILIALVERGESIEAVAGQTGLGVSAVSDISARVKRYAFKRALEPPYPSDKFYE